MTFTSNAQYTIFELLPQYFICVLFSDMVNYLDLCILSDVWILMNNELQKKLL
jgi:hypothetical protein